MAGKKTIAAATAKEIKVLLSTIPVIQVPLGSLSIWDGNVRQDRDSAAYQKGIQELAAMIAAVGGLIHPLAVKTGKKAGKYEVIAGGRRLDAMMLLSGDKKQKGWTNGWTKDTLVDVRVLPEGINYTEISLQENSHEPMHPADQFDAFHRLYKDGVPVADIAARFGVTQNVVEQRLALAKVSPYLMEQYRKGDMTLQVLQVFTLTDDHQKQEDAWNSTEKYSRQSEYAIRQKLLNKQVNDDDIRVRCVGLEAYEAAGGRVAKSLFEDETYILDVTLLDQLTNEKLQAKADRLKADGWSWVDIWPSEDYKFLGKCGHAKANIPGNISGQIKAKEKELAKIQDELDLEDTTDERAEELNQRHHDLSREIDTLEEQSEKEAYSDEQKEVCGCALWLGYSGIEIRYGLIRPEDKKKAADAAPVTTGQGDGTTLADSSEPQETYSQALTQELTEHKTAIVAAELLDNTRAGLGLVAFTLLQGAFEEYLQFYGDGGIHMSCSRTNLGAANGYPAYDALAAEESALIKMLPESRKPEAVFFWCMTAPAEDIHRLLTFCAARSLDAIHKAGLAELDKTTSWLVNRVGLEVGANRPQKWFTATAENFFGRIPKGKMLDILTQAGRPADDETKKLKKADLANVMQVKLEGTDFVPGILQVEESEEPKNQALWRSGLNQNEDEEEEDDFGEEDDFEEDEEEEEEEESDPSDVGDEVYAD